VKVGVSEDATGAVPGIPGNADLVLNGVATEWTDRPAQYWLHNPCALGLSPGQARNKILNSRRPPQLDASENISGLILAIGLTIRRI